MGEAQGTPSPGGPNSFNFMQFFGKIWQNHMLPPRWRVGAPRLGGNPGSATAFVDLSVLVSEYGM